MAHRISDQPLSQNPTESLTREFDDNDVSARAPASSGGAPIPPPARWPAAADCRQGNAMMAGMCPTSSVDDFVSPLRSAGVLDTGLLGSLFLVQVHRKALRNRRVTNGSAGHLRRLRIFATEPVLLLCTRPCRLGTERLGLRYERSSIRYFPDRRMRIAGTSFFCRWCFGRCPAYVVGFGISMVLARGRRSP